MGFLDLVFPKYCLECRKEMGLYLCMSCLSRVGKGRKLTRFGLPTYPLFRYEGVIRKAILGLKYKFASEIGVELAKACETRIQETDLQNLENALVIPIPLHSKRLNWRGFNQAALVGERLANAFNWDFEIEAISRLENTLPQVGLEKGKRLRNLSGKFAVNSEIIEKLKNRKIIIFDDVYTTGGTVKECAEVLSKVGVESVVALTIAG